MHIPDGFLNNGVAGGFLALSAAVSAFCAGKVLKTITCAAGTLAAEGGQSCSSGLALNPGSSLHFQKMAMAAIWVFAFQMFNLPVQSATSVHLIGGVFTAVLVGPFAGFLVLSSVLIIQSLFFADGGFLALGANIFNMAFIGALASYYVFKSLRKANYYIAVTAACFFSVLCAALFCLIELSVSGTVSFSAAFSEMMGLHFLFAAVETVLTVVLLKIFSKWGYNENK